MQLKSFNQFQETEKQKLEILKRINQQKYGRNISQISTKIKAIQLYLVYIGKYFQNSYCTSYIEQTGYILIELNDKGSANKYFSKQFLQVKLLFYKTAQDLIAYLKQNKNNVAKSKINSNIARLFAIIHLLHYNQSDQLDISSQFSKIQNLRQQLRIKSLEFTEIKQAAQNFQKIVDQQYNQRKVEIAQNELKLHQFNTRLQQQYKQKQTQLAQARLQLLTQRKQITHQALLQIQKSKTSYQQNTYSIMNESKQLKIQIKSWKDQYQFMQEQRNRAKVSLNTLQIQLNKVNKEVLEAQKTKKKMLQQIQSLKKQNQSTNTKLTSSQRDNAYWKNNYVELKRNNEIQINKNQILSQQLQQKKETNTELINKNTYIELLRSEVEQQLKSLKFDHSLLQKEMQIKNQSFDQRVKSLHKLYQITVQQKNQLRDEKIDVQHKYQWQQIKIIGLQQQLKMFEHSNKFYQQRVAKLVHQYSEASNSLSEEKTIVKRHQQELYELSKQNTDKKQKIDQYKLQLYELQQLYRGLSNENKQAKFLVQQIQQKYEKLNKQQQQKKVLEMSLIEKSTNYGSKIQQIEQKYQKLKVQKVQIQQRLTESNIKANKLQAQFDELQIQFNQTKVGKNITEYNYKNQIKNLHERLFYKTQSLEEKQKVIQLLKQQKKNLISDKERMHTQSNNDKGLLLNVITAQHDMYQKNMQVFTEQIVHKIKQRTRNIQYKYKHKMSTNDLIQAVDDLKETVADIIQDIKAEPAIPVQSIQPQSVIVPQQKIQDEIIEHHQQIHADIVQRTQKMDQKIDTVVSNIQKLQNVLEQNLRQAFQQEKANIDYKNATQIRKLQEANSHLQDLISESNKQIKKQQQQINLLKQALTKKSQKQATVQQKQSDAHYNRKLQEQFQQIKYQPETKQIQNENYKQKQAKSPPKRQIQYTYRPPIKKSKIQQQWQSFYGNLN